jgi:phosphatidylserine decarboxylase
LTSLPLARDGFPLIGTALGAMLVAALGAFATSGPVAGGLAAVALLLAVATVFLINFFRDPERTPPLDPGLFVSPADGRVLLAEDSVEESRFLQTRAAKVSIFMSPVDVHVNRAPITGAVTGVHYRPGQYRAAFSDKSSLDNEQNAIVMRSAEGRALVFVQIAGFLARRIVCRVRPDDRVERGQRVGMIKLGSRVDIFVAGDVTLRVRPGDRERAGETVLGELR